jgi:hypothetical protein
LKSNIENDNPEELKRETIHGKFCRDLERPNVGKEKSLAWVCSSDIFGESESLIIAAKDQTLSTRYNQRNNTKQLRVNAGCATMQKNTKNILLRDAQHLNYFNTRRYSKVASYVHWMV